MISIKRLASALCLALCFSGYSNAQDYTTGNLITSGTGHTWTGVTTGPLPSNYMPGGPQPIYDPSTNTISFSYGQATASQNIAVNQALANVGSGIRINGYNYSYQARNMNGDDRQGGIDTFTVSTALKSSTGTTLLSSSETYNVKFDWTTVNGTRTTANPYDLAQVSTLTFSVTGKDGGFWAGYFGPQVRNVDVRLNYSVDPCVSNPLYASHCPGFNDIVTSGNLMGSNPSVSWGQSFNEIIAINTALQHGGLGVRVHGFQWGYDVLSNDPYCAGWFMFCYDNRDPLARTTVNITNSQGQSIYSVTRDYNDINSWQSRSYSYNLTNSTNSLNLGNFSIQGQTWDLAGIQNVYVTAKYTPDQCVANPLYSTSCTGYAQAYFNQQCTLNPLYSQDCAGYAQAYYNQQCSLSALYDSGCPGYAQAYYNQQCTLNPLYDSGCPGYAQAFFNQQCTLNPLYNTQCPGYAEAKVLKDLQEKQTTAETFAVPTPSITKVETSSPTVALADPTRTETVVTTDVGGVELTTSGQVSIPTGQPTATKEAIKEATVEKKEEKKTVNPKNLMLAQAAVKEAERTALSTAADAVAYSQSDAATSAAVGFGPGVVIQGNRGQGSSDTDSQNNVTTQNRSQNNDLQNRGSITVQNQEQQQKNSPGLRNGGKVEGMEGGPDPTQLAKAPMDFNQYLQLQLQDSQFYASKEIYKGQRTVDNARAERFLNGKSDVLHQRMIEQQYNIGN